MTGHKAGGLAGRQAGLKAGIEVRGLWRWWETKNGADLWWARVETSPGAWTDLSPEDYAAKGCAPPFWDLPLQEDRIQQLVIDPAAERHWTVEQRAAEFTIMGLMLIGSIVVVIAIVGFVLFERLGF